MEALQPLKRLFPLSIGVSRTQVRHGNIMPRFKRPRPDLTGFEKDWGEEIWVWRHKHSGQVVYSHSEIMDSNKALAQLPFNGKKTVPTKLRKDFWAKMARIDFGKGQGVIGRSVFQKLREFRRLHELCWGNEILRDEKGKTRNKHDRKFALCNQVPNTVADIAAVLAGAGKGNLMNTTKPGTNQKVLRKARVFWVSDLDKLYAQEWTDNVTHKEFPVTLHVYGQQPMTVEDYFDLNSKAWHNEAEGGGQSKSNPY